MRRRKNQFPLVDCSTGAPMGRHEHGLPQNNEPRTVQLFQVRLDGGGYDDGGAYWGRTSPVFLYCAWSKDREYRRFTRAKSRKEAMTILELNPEQLIAPIETDPNLYKVRTYNLRTYDVWGSAKIGFQVNDSYNHGEVSIRCKRCTYNKDSSFEFHQWEPTDRQLSRSSRFSRVIWEASGDGIFYANLSTNGKPIGELIEINREEKK